MEKNMQNFEKMEEHFNQSSHPTGDSSDIRGELTYEDKVVQKIVGYALEHVDGLLSVEGGFFSNLTGKLVNTNNVTSGVDVEVGKTQVAVDLKIITEYGKNVPDIYEEIKNVITKKVADITALDVVEVNVTVTDIKTKSEQEEDEVTVQDRVVDAAQSTGEFTSKQVGKVKGKVDDMTPDKRRVD